MIAFPRDTANERIMMGYSDLPHLNAFLNAVSALLALAGYYCIRRGRWHAHRSLMTGALTASALFLLSYLAYHAHAGSVRYQGAGWRRPAYLTLLISHSVLAAAVVPMIFVTFSRALKGRLAIHKRIARVTLPVWLYVSLTGVLVYLVLYQL
jgi:putative membrane protein